MEDDHQERPEWIAELHGTAETEEWVEPLLWQHGIPYYGGTTWGPYLEVWVAREKAVAAVRLLKAEAEKRGCFGVFRLIEQEGRRYQPVAEFMRSEGTGVEVAVRDILREAALDALVVCQPWRGIVYATPLATPEVVAALRAPGNGDFIRVYETLRPPLESTEVVAPAPRPGD
jgi:hypothetical protein